jgi:hypothetical protein
VVSRLEEVRRPASHYVTEKMMGPAEGIEPTLPCEKRILNQSRLQSQDDLLLLRTRIGGAHCAEIADPLGALNDPLVGLLRRLRHQSFRR